MVVVYGMVVVRGGSREFCWGENFGERGSASLCGGLGACQWGPGHSPWSGGLGGQSPPEADAFYIFKFKFLMKNTPFLSNLNVSHHAEI